MYLTYVGAFADVVGRLALHRPIMRLDIRIG